MTDLKNPKDPLGKASPADLEIFRRFRQAAHGEFSPANVVNAGVNITLIALRQSFDNRNDAVAELNRITAIMRQRLEDHYFPNGSRRPNFAWDQQIVINTIIDARAQPLQG